MTSAPEPPLPDPTKGLRLSDNDRFNAINTLSIHYSEGRLGKPEFDDRSRAISEATTMSDLDGLFTDLPGGLPVGSNGLPAVAFNPDEQAEADTALREADELKKKGSLVENLDWVILGSTLLIFLALSAAGFAYAWFVWPTLILTLSIPRLLLKYSYSDESLYETMKKDEIKLRKQRLKEAEQRRKELGY